MTETGLDLRDLYDAIYRQGKLFGVDHTLPADPLHAAGKRPLSIAVEGGAFGDEGKGKVVDELCHAFARSHGRVVIYRWNGGANAGHTVVFGDQRVVLHQLPSGALTSGATVILGKGMVIHPGDLVIEIERVKTALAGAFPATLMIDEMAVLSLDTHRAFEGALKGWERGGAGATGRGISPAYADVLLRHPVRVRDLTAADWTARLGKHYDLYAALSRGLDSDLAAQTVPALDGSRPTVGTQAEFLARLAGQRETLIPLAADVSGFVAQAWWDHDLPFVFEGAQAVGLDPRFGVYPDITASDPTFDGILHSTEGIIAPHEIAVLAATIKATYTSSVGIRRLPTHMDEALAHRIREDAHEYGATTRRPRDIAHIDIPCLRYYARVSRATHVILTHLDISYSDADLCVCTSYHNQRGESVPYRPDQDYLLTVTPQYVTLPAWEQAAVKQARQVGDLPRAAVQYIAYLSQALGMHPLMGTTGPERDAIVSWLAD